MTQRTKTFLPSFVAFAILAGIAVWYFWFRHQITLVDLQKQYLFAKTEAEKEKVIDRLEDYYLNLDVPDSLRQRVDDEVQTLLDTTAIDLTDYSDAIFDESNVYILENRLKDDVIKTALIARARDDIQTFAALMQVARRMAEIVDEGTENEYWVRFVEDLGPFTRENANSWLKAEQAGFKCGQNYANSNSWEIAERYGAICLKYLNKINNPRLQLDISQRLQLILYKFRTMHELSIGLAKRSLFLANKINYPLRANSITYYCADALHLAGQNNLALGLFCKVIKKAEKYKEFPPMLWYKKNSFIRLTYVYWQLGKYKKALSVCNEVEQFELSNNEKINLHIARGLVNRSLGNFDTAELEYEKAFNFSELANDYDNQIRILNNLGTLFHILKEFDIALEKYEQAITLLDKFNPDNYELKILTITNIAEVMVKKNSIGKFDELIREANRLVNLVNLPNVRAHQLRTLGRLNLELQKYNSALKHFEEAKSIYDDIGLLRSSLETKINLIESMMGLSRTAEAKTIALETYELAKQIFDEQRIIDSIAMLAEIEKREGNIQKAVEISNQLIYKIEESSSRFNNMGLLTSYRQKIYDYLKNAVVYEIYNNRIDLAYVKLDYAKARSLKNSYNYGNGHSTNSNVESFVNKYVDIDIIQSQLDKQSLILDYLVMQDTLYNFILGHKELQLLKKPINADELEKRVHAYKDSIVKTIKVFSKYNQKKISTHFNATTQIGHQLFNNLLGWPELEKSLKKIELLYIVPDEFLYELPFATMIVDIKPLTYLVDKTAVVNLPGSSFLQSTDGILETQPLSNKKVLISADPSLPEVKHLISFLKSFFHSAVELKVKKDISKEDIIDKLSENHDIYIFIGHGAANANHPEQSYIELTAINSVTSKSKTMPVMVSDLKNINWSGAEMVLLVGCETGSGKVYRGTGISGLQQQFIAMGARNVAASLWEIDAREAIPQIREFIKSWSRGLEPAIALKKTQLQSINELNKNKYYDSPHPYFWASLNLLSRN